LSTCIARQEFDSRLFDRPFYRVRDTDLTALEVELEQLGTIDRLVIDAKLRADKVELGAFLQRRGFRKICTQIELQHDLSKALLKPVSSGTILERLDVTAETLAAHASNFKFDRFALDVLLPSDAHDRLYREWINNSLTNGKHKVVARGHNFISFRDDGSRVKIDLVSVLDAGRGVATDLLRTLLIDARDRGKSSVEVTTECENLTAVGLYTKVGFVPVNFVSVFHLVKE
jgi:hypothetical protein